MPVAGPKGQGNLAQALAWVDQKNASSPEGAAEREEKCTLIPEIPFVEIHVVPLQDGSVFVLKSDPFVMLFLIGHVFDHGFERRLRNRERCRIRSARKIAMESFL